MLMSGGVAGGGPKPSLEVGDGTPIGDPKIVVSRSKAARVAWAATSLGDRLREGLLRGMLDMRRSVP